nr:hypothetical protein [Paenibacillus oleatilyticus]
MWTNLTLYLDNTSRFKIEYDNVLESEIGKMLYSIHFKACIE